MHGYDLYKKLNSLEGVSLVWRVKQSQLYALLEKLEEDGLLVSQQTMGTNYPPRKEFQVTDVGGQTLSAWLKSPAMHGREMRQEFLARLYFAIQDGPETALELLDEQRAACLEWLEQIQGSLERLSFDQVYESFVYQFRRHEIEAIIRWLDECRGRISRR